MGMKPRRRAIEAVRADLDRVVTDVVARAELAEALDELEHVRTQLTRARARARAAQRRTRWQRSYHGRVRRPRRRGQAPNGVRPRF